MNTEGNVDAKGAFDKQVDFKLDNHETKHTVGGPRAGQELITGRDLAHMEHGIFHILGEDPVTRRPIYSPYPHLEKK